MADTCELWQPGRIDAEGNPAPTECPNPLHIHTVENPFNHPGEFIAERRAAQQADERSRPKFDHGLNTTDEGWHAEMWRRMRLHQTLRHEANYYGVSSPYLLIPPFSEADLWGHLTKWRPWGRVTDITEASPFQMQSAERFKAILNAVDREHEDDHWFYQHPFCMGCFPNDPVDDRLAGWMLRHGERGFPAHTWDGVLPLEPEDESDLDFMTVDDLAALPEPGWLIHDVLPDSGTGVLRARDQSFKSFMALDMSLQVVFHKYGKVLYCVGEGANNFGHRIDAWLEHNDEEFDEEIPGPTLLPAVPNLFTGGDLYDRVLAQARAEQYDLIVIDTYARATAGSDLNSQGDQAVVTARIDELKRATGGTVLLVAHSQKSDLDASGSIEIEDARDFVFSMKRNGSEVTFEVTKQKDGAESGRPVRYVAEPVGRSIVLVEAGELGDKPLMSTKEWIIAALDNTRGLGPQSEAEIRQWINTHPDYRRLGNKELTKSTSSSALSRLVEAGSVAKAGTRYSASASPTEEAS